MVPGQVDRTEFERSGSMTAGEIREMEWSNCATERENLFAVLREIAVQLAEIRVALAQSGPGTAPTLKKRE
jgi:hypothetical protein